MRSPSLYQNHTKISQKRKLYNNITNKYKQKVLSKIITKIIQQHIQRVRHHDQVTFIPGMQSFYNICKSINVIHHNSKLKNKNHIIISIDAKNFWKISPPIYDKNYLESGHRRNLPKHNKGHIQQTYRKHLSQWLKTKQNKTKFILRLGTKDKDVQSHHSYST